VEWVYSEFSHGVDAVECGGTRLIFRSRESHCSLAFEGASYRSSYRKHAFYSPFNIAFGSFWRAFLVYSATVSLLALPGFTPDTESGVPLQPTAGTVARLSGLLSIYFSLSGILSCMILIWIHQPSVSNDVVQPLSSSGVTQAVSFYIPNRSRFF